MDRRRAARIGIEHVEVADTAGHPIVYADWLHAAGAPTVLVYCHYDVQPVDPLELWETAAVRAVRRATAGSSAAARPTTRARSTCTSWPPRRSSRPRGALPVNLTVRVRGRGGIELGEPRTPGSRPTGSASTADVVDHQRHGLLRGQPARRSRVGLRGMMYAQIDVVGLAGRPPLGRLRRRGPEPGQRPGPDHRGAEGARRARSGSRASTTTSCALTDEERAEIGRAAVRRGGATASAIRRAGARRRAGLHDPRAQGHPADARRQRDLGRLPGRGRQDDHPGPRPRQGQLPAGRRPGSRRRSSPRLRDYVAEVAPPGRDRRRSR